MNPIPDPPKDSVVTLRDSDGGPLELSIPTQKWDHLRNAVLALVIGGCLLAYFHEELWLFASGNVEGRTAAELGFGGSLIIGVLILLLMKRASALGRVFQKVFSAREYGLTLRISPEAIEIGSDEDEKSFEAKRIRLDKISRIEVGKRRPGDFVYGNRTDNLVKISHGARTECIALPTLEEARWLEDVLSKRLLIATEASGGDQPAVSE